MRKFLLPNGRAAVMGVINATPDSFSDGGKYCSVSEAVNEGLRMAANGADLIDVGGESTRPGAEPVSVEDELGRVLPVVEGLCRECVFVSIDTRKASVAREAVKAGASVVNDVSGLRDSEMVAVCASLGATVCIMHMLGEPETMQRNPVYGDVVGEIKTYLLGQVNLALAAGIKPEDIWIDPGFGFGKSYEHTLEMFHRFEEFCEIGFPVVIGVSRKSFLGRMAASEGVLPVNQRLEAALAVQTLVQMKGARVIRTHDVEATRRAVDAIRSIS